MKDFKISSRRTGEFKVRLDEIRIPTYIILLLFTINKFPTYGKFGKSLFACTFEYSKTEFMIEDYRGFKCRICSIQNDENSKLLSKQIRTKIMKACDLLDRVLSDDLMKQVEGGNFYLHNSYTILNRYFHVISSDLSKQLANLNKEFKKYEDFSDAIKFYFKSGWKIEQYSFSLLNIFFSITDFIFLIFHIMENKQPSWSGSSEFMKFSWQKKFRALKISNNQIESYYVDLIRFKRFYRNPISHGIVGEYSLLVPFDGIGLIPMSYKHPINYMIFGISPKDAENIVRTTRGFLDLLKDTPPYNFYMKFLSHALPIPVNKKDLLELKSRMTDLDTFSDYVESEARMQDMIDNFDY